MKGVDYRVGGGLDMNVRINLLLLVFFFGYFFCLFNIDCFFEVIIFWVKI